MAIEKVKRVSRPKIRGGQTITPRANTTMNRTASPRITTGGTAAKSFAKPIGATANASVKRRGAVADMPVVKKKYSVK